MLRFNLLTEPWVPCVLADASVCELGLRGLLRRAPDIREIVDPSPLVTVALHRLLLAVLHRNFGPATPTAWRAMWEGGAWDQATLDAYFGCWQDRFDLFDEEHPFYQTARLDFCYERPVTQLSHELASGANPATLFDHTLDPSLTPAQAARYLVAHQAFALGGLVSLEKGQDPGLFKAADAAPLTKSAVALVKGNDLFRRLMLNLHQYDPSKGFPFPESTPRDAPAWERDEEMAAGDRWPDGYLDLLTWQSRRIRLHPETDRGGGWVVRSVVIMKGWQFPDAWRPQGRETMVAFRKNLRGKESDPWPALSLREDRAVWRDSRTLFQATGADRARPRMIDWLHDLVDRDALDQSMTLSLDVYGLSSDRAKVFLWRHECLPLPLRYLEDGDLLDALRRGLQLAEDTAQALDRSTRTFARLVVAPSCDRPGSRQPDPGDVNALVDSLAPGRAYWSRLETPFRELVAKLPQDVSTAEDGGVEYGANVLRDWADTLRRVGEEALHRAIGGTEASARVLKAFARAERAWSRASWEVLGPYLQSEEVMSESTN